MEWQTLIFFIFIIQVLCHKSQLFDHMQIVLNDTRYNLNLTETYSRFNSRRAVNFLVIKVIIVYSFKSYQITQIYRFVIIIVVHSAV